MSIACPQAKGASTMNTADTMTIVNELRTEVICILLSNRGSLKFATQIAFRWYHARRDLACTPSVCADSEGLDGEARLVTVNSMND
jgi:hypothetical protein